MKDINYSILLSVYKSENASYFNECLNSIVNQTLQADQIVIVVDGPITNELEKVLEFYLRNDYEKSRFKVIRLDNNVGLGEALNIGLKYCENELVARIDTDDIATHRRMEIQAEYLTSNPKIDVLGSFANDIDEQSRHLKLRTVPLKHEEIKKVIWTNPMIHPSIMYRKSKILKIGSYNSNIRRRQDYELWFRAVDRGLIFENIAEPLLLYRVTDDYFKKNNLKQQMNQLKIGLLGCIKIKASPIAYFGLFAPIIRGLSPKFMKNTIVKIMGYFDPRGKE